MQELRDDGGCWQASRSRMRQQQVLIVKIESCDCPSLPVAHL